MNSYLGMDLGETTLGLAVNIGNCVILLKPIYYKVGDFKFVLNELESIFERYDIKKIVIGNPIIENITSKISNMVKYFSVLLESKFNIKVYTINENFTTKIAKNIYFQSNKNNKLKNFNKIKDSFAAKIILEEFIKNYRN
ncbi:RuvX/YqgF family protein [Mycoplasma sp. SG1]|uniref:RuvX/YqgF family protein n=1 Tax=Mycoplasma sp. SG1 TaxID=2810348 RepID=UPI0020258E83|nr:RuvX/YqgF family protein [Mycoplasma sp. SG1]URM53139.1 Holliday junction resolvase RuvX [Mycoplasma sp. SG1]